MRRILVLRGGALGDFIVTLPALALLRQRWPAAEIELVGNAAAAALARSRGLLTSVFSQHDRRWIALYGNDPLPAEMAAWLANFDLVLNYWPDPDGELQRRFPVRPGQRFLTKAALPECAPAAAHYCQPLAQLGLTTNDYNFHLAEHLGANADAAGPIIIHPGSGSSRKNWPMERWLELIPQLPAQVLVILGEAELPRWSRLTTTGFQEVPPPSNQRVGDNTLHLVNQPLEELVVHFSRCRLFLGHDSGISHLAAACGAPCLLLFGPTDPAMWAPPAPRVRTIRRGQVLDSISVEDVRRALLAALADPK